MSDALLLRMPWRFENWGESGIIDVNRVILRNQSFWIEALPIMTEHTSRPDIMSSLIEQITGGSSMGGMGGGHSDTSNKTSEALTEVLKACSQRLQERMEAESMPEIVLPTTQGLPGGVF